ncbi:hypothetical protein FEK33_14540 [Nocardia asteroides NBRC 15531]|uniref:Uncharacterized protein n=1 Tax=Nocardia asteroides NBRC 15531 TaxID=1110697 RepID=U5EIM8_NOCAS|nr:hypothetical protein [Nocardia asteroides]TLF67197.1 hypothetical protein FEK33_14540 [Nocardia asteroides NBRC 15531]UGT51516.1 hypothetical protein LT345_13645 [Nocardia asteroides]SFM24489.1 hypothetical protein SAMN05444423_102371 [Nocardia asteroides]VEG35587.1 Uncharacterised protein [Nocardia asteroides]GAD86251.1 hypothetical protein NCAST_32_07380 [Nocardia asteroides NBRC 15531]
MSTAKRFGAAVIASVALVAAAPAATGAPGHLAVATPVATTGSALTDILVAPVLFPLGFLVLALCGPAPEPTCPMAQIYAGAATGSGVR